MKLALAILFMAVQAQAATLYVKPVTDVPTKIAFDSASTNDGTWVSTVTMSTNAPLDYPRSIYLGGSQYVGITNALNSSLAGASSVTIEAWVNPSSLAGGSNCEFFHIWGGATYSLNIGIMTNALRVGGRATNSSGYCSTTYPYTITNAWVHVAGVMNYYASNALLYVNGALVSSNVAAFTRTNYAAPASSISIGSYSGGAAYFIGHLSDVRLWRVERSAAEISANYTNRLTGTEAGLVGYWRLDERQLNGLDWQYAYTNIQSAIDSSSAGDTVLVASGTYNAAVTINKNNLTVRGGNGTLWDADRTIIDRQSASNSVGVYFVGATNSTLKGVTVMGTLEYGITVSGISNAIDSVIVRGTRKSAVAGTTNNYLRNSIVVGNDESGGALGANVGNIVVQNCVIEANAVSVAGRQMRRCHVQNSLYGYSQDLINLGGNITNNTTNSVCQQYSIAPASVGVGTNLVWAGVASYIPSIGSLAQGAGVGYDGIDAAKSGDGGPALLPINAKFLGRDSSTNDFSGSFVGAYEFVAGPSALGGNTINFNSNKRIQVPVAYTGTTYTIEMWVKSVITSTTQRIAFDTELGRNLIYYPRQVGQFGFFDGSDKLFPIPVGGTNEWTHLSFVFDGAAATCLVYVAGAFYGGAAYSPKPIGGRTSIGSRYTDQTGNWSFYQGAMADVRIWNYARTTNDVRVDYTNRLTGTETGLVGYWRLDETEMPITAGPFNIRNPAIQPSFMEAF